MTQMRREMGRGGNCAAKMLSLLLRPSALFLLALALLACSSSILILMGGSDNGVVKIEQKLSESDPLKVWEMLLKPLPSNDGIGGGENKNQQRRRTAIEVGVHAPMQCIRAAELGYDTHCFEPSPKSFSRIENDISRMVTSQNTKDRLHIHRVAVGSTSGSTIPFLSTGGTGDHVGEYDMWKMKRRSVRGGSDAGGDPKRGTIVQVPTIRLDDFIASHDFDGNHVHLLKVDTQGFEPSIFLGLEKSIKDASINYIIFEFWPRGMDLLADKIDECFGHRILDQLLASGYTLYALKVESHPKAPLTSQSLKNEAKTRPYQVQSTKEYCQWFFDLEKKHPGRTGEEEYKFGYWSDFLAVAPGVDLHHDVK